LNNKTKHFILTKITPAVIVAVVMALVFGGVLTPSFQGADGKVSKITDDDFCRVSAFSPSESTPEEVSEACKEAKKLTFGISPFVYILFTVIGIVIMSSVVLPHEQWDQIKRGRSAV